MHRSMYLIVVALLATAACNLAPSVEGAAGMAQERTCGSALTYGGCVTGNAAEASAAHGRHVVLLRRGDQIRVTMSRIGGDLNPGLAIKSPKYSAALRYDSVDVHFDGDDPATRRPDSVEKTWTIKSTGFYTLVAFPWSHKGSGAYQMSLDCEGGPCLQGMTMDAEVAGACIGEARDCSIRALSTGAQATADEAFDACMVRDTMPALCSTACRSGACAETVTRLRPFEGLGAECLGEIESCLSDCVPHNTGYAVADLASHPDMVCWTSAGRPNCSTFGTGLRACGAAGSRGGYAKNTPAWCTAMCNAREGAGMNETCTERCAPQPNADVETPDLPSAE